MDRLLVIDTSVATAVVALGTRSGELLSEASWQAGYRHGEELLGRIDGLLREAGLGLADVGAIVAGTGPGAFTGMRVGLATAKALARGLDVPIVGVPSSSALLEAAAASRDLVASSSGAGGPAPSAGGRAPSAPGPERSARLALMLPAGPSDRIVVLDGSPTLVRGGDRLELPDGTTIVAVDLDGRAPDDAAALGQVAVRGLGAALLRLGAARLARGERDDVAKLVPEYVTLPRGVRSVTGGVTWSRERT